MQLTILNSIPDQLGTRFIRTKRLLFVCGEINSWCFDWFNSCNLSSLPAWDSEWSVRIHKVSDSLVTNCRNCHNVSVRGLLSSAIAFYGNLGLLLAFTLGNYGNYSTIPVVSIILSIIFTISFLFFPECPAFSARHNRLSVCSHTNSIYKLSSQK